MHGAPTSPDEAGERLAALAPELLGGDPRSCNFMASRARTVLKSVPLAWLPSVDRAMRDCEDAGWLSMRPAMLARPRPGGIHLTLLTLCASHPDPGMRLIALRGLDALGGNLHVALVHCDDPEPAVLHAAYADVRRQLRRPGSAHAFVSNLPLVLYLRHEAQFDHDGLLQEIYARLREPAGRRALEVATQRSDDPELQESLADLWDELG